MFLFKMSRLYPHASYTRPSSSCTEQISLSEMERSEEGQWWRGGGGGKGGREGEGTASESKCETNKGINMFATDTAFAKPPL